MHEPEPEPEPELFLGDSSKDLSNNLDKHILDKWDKRLLVLTLIWGT